MTKIGRNAPCPCGSGKKYKKCCLGKEKPRPSVTEMLDEEMRAGYRRSMEGDGARACTHWARVWETIRERLRPEMRTIDDAAAVFSGTQALYDWIQDYLLELRNVAVHRRSYAETGVRFYEEVLAQFPDESELFLINLRGDMGELLCLSGESERGERVFLELIEDYPDNAAGYAFLADLLGYGPTPGSEPIDRQRAQRVLEEALARPVADAADYDLELRLSDLRGTSPPEGGDFPA